MEEHWSYSSAFKGGKLDKTKLITWGRKKRRKGTSYCKKVREIKATWTKTSLLECREKKGRNLHLKQKFLLKNEKEIPGKENSCAKIKNTREIHVLKRL